MDVQEAVQIAKELIREVFSGEDIGSVRLEEVVFERGGKWKITISFTRPRVVRGAEAAFAVFGGQQYSRSMKVVLIDEDSGDVVSVTNREPIN